MSMRHPHTEPVYHTQEEIKKIQASGYMYIYALCDPDTMEIRYVGKSNRMYKRMLQHMQKARNAKLVYHSANWIRSLIEAGKVPLISILETIQPDMISTWQEREIYWIGRLRQEGYSLTNTTEGGDGVIGGKGRLGKKNSPEHSAKVSVARKGRKMPYSDPNGKKAAHLRELHAYYREHPEEKKWGHHTAESKAKISAANTGKKRNISDLERAKMVERATKRGRESGIPVMSINPQTGEMKCYPSTKAAGDELAICRTGITNCLKGKAKTAGGYKWIRAADFSTPNNDTINHDNTI